MTPPILCKFDNQNGQLKPSREKIRTSFIFIHFTPRGFCLSSYFVRKNVLHSAILIRLRKSQNFSRNKNTPECGFSESKFFCHDKNSTSQVFYSVGFGGFKRPQLRQTWLSPLRVRPREGAFRDTPGAESRGSRRGCRRQDC